MGSWPERLHTWLPSRVATRGVLLIALCAVSVAGPGYIAYRALADQVEERTAFECEAFLAAALATQLERGECPAEERAEWLSRIAAQGQRLRWAAVFDSDGAGIEFHRRTGVDSAEIAAQVDLTRTTPQRKPLLLGGTTVDRFELLTLPLPRERAVLAVILDRGPLAANPMTTRGLLAGLCCVACGGLGLAWMLFRTGVEGPIRALSARLISVHAGLSDAAQSTTLPTELAELANSIVGLETDLQKWRVEANYWRNSLDTAVDARTRRATAATRRAEREAETDTLTKLGNRRLLDRELPKMLQLQRVSGGELSLILFDVNYFKQLNDTRGHQAGDEVLAFIGNLLRGMTRKGIDLAARIGGDEFVLVMPGTSALEAAAVARRMAMMFAQQVRARATPEAPLGLSAGVAAMHKSGDESAEELLRTADEVMYWAKRQRCGVATVQEMR